MIPVPSTRLLWTIFGVALLAAAAGPLPELKPAWILALLGAAVFALLDLVLSLQRLVPPEPSTPAVVRFTKDREGLLPVTFANPGGRPWRLRFAVALPAAFEHRAAELAVALPAGVPRAQIGWT